MAIFVLQTFSDADLAELKGNMGVGHVRYSTLGGRGVSTTNVQPFVVDTVHGLLAVAHNGELVNAKKLRREVRACLFDLLLNLSEF